MTSPPRLRAGRWPALLNKAPGWSIASPTGDRETKRNKKKREERHRAPVAVYGRSLLLAPGWTIASPTGDKETRKRERKERITRLRPGQWPGLPGSGLDYDQPSQDKRTRYNERRPGLWPGLL